MLWSILEILLMSFDKSDDVCKDQIFLLALVLYIVGVPRISTYLVSTPLPNSTKMWGVLFWGC
jgi:hypothetical protein